MRIIPPILILLLCAFSLQSHARMYRWVDDDGVTVYSQTPPTDRQAQEIAPPSPHRGAPPSAPEATQSRPAPRTATKPEIEHASIAKRNCEIARRNLQLYQTPGNHRYKAKDGSYQYLSQEIKEEKIAGAKKQIETFCAE